MRSLLLLCLIVLIAGCEQQPADVANLNMETIEHTPSRRVAVETPQLISDQEALTKPKPTGEPSEAVTDTATDALPLVLPFAPTIGMDPVDGNKISITKSTPVTEYKGRFYYFGSEANKRAFVASPDQYLDNQLGRF